jgi:hypothetical protein
MKDELRTDIQDENKMSLHGRHNTSCVAFLYLVISIIVLYQDVWIRSPCLFIFHSHPKDSYLIQYIYLTNCFCQGMLCSRWRTTTNAKYCTSTCTKSFLVKRENSIYNNNLKRIVHKNIIHVNMKRIWRYQRGNQNP